MDITYTISITITRAVCACEEDAVVEAGWMESAEAKWQLEREVLQALRKLDGDCDCEVMDTERVHD